ncbi:Putative 4'-phosphopantetheinyl transferase slr0495 [Fibrisoma limi BUZ 3]|uniref:Putative 4'-phosphopantetheinyl transferase slr0495 n=1 Tax=Fibrisoma limi BUZ 3 TaxID=1185876 RepID=I2GT90_9BACT|nr:4'-phosphopantetheinyl transferase superfamily protein [Fibrisoma limi]CCH57119.1 Putative 4'-phosphopantetheinyl transferase slr0495 [Fibrisoma limi BUZ 3]
MSVVIVRCGSLGDVSWLDADQWQWANEPLLFRASVEEFTPYIPQFEAVLSSAERQRANRFHQPADRQRYVLGKVVSRFLLGKLSDQSPASVQFAVDTSGKPHLLDNDQVQFNISHAGNWVLVSLAAVAVGVDVEQVRPSFRYEGVLAHSFSAEEQRYVTESADPRRVFFRLWTRKEALAKGIGTGLLDDLTNLPSLDGNHALEKQAGSSLHNWSVLSFNLVTDYEATLAWTGLSDQTRVAFYHLGPGSLQAAH